MAKKSKILMTGAVAEEVVSDVPATSVASTPVASAVITTLVVTAANDTSDNLPENVASKSQYTSPPVTLRIGPQLQPYFVPEILLQSLATLPRSVSGDSSIELQDVVADTGHVFVHFLHTGQYQILQDLHLDHDTAAASARAKSRFKKALLAYVAAKKYKLVTLQGLAKQEIIRCADEMSMSHAAHAISKDTLTELQEDATWLQDLVLQKAEKTFEEDDAIFSTAGFFSSVKNLKIAKLLARHVAKLYRERMLQQRELIDTLRERSDVAVEDAIEDKLEEVDWQAVQGAVDDAIEDAVKQVGQEAVSEIVDEPATAVSATLPVDKSSPASQAMGTPLSGAECPIARENTLQAALELVVTEEHVPDAPIASAQPRLETKLAAEGNDVIVAGSSTSANEEWCVLSTTDATSSQHPTALDEEQATLDEKQAIKAHFKAKTGPFEGLTKRETMILRRKLKAKATAREEEAEAQLWNTAAVCAPSVPFEQESGAKRDDAPLVAVAEVGSLDPFAGLSKAQRKKLEKKMKEEAAAREEAEAQLRDTAAMYAPSVPFEQESRAERDDTPLDEVAGDERLDPFIVVAGVESFNPFAGLTKSQRKKLEKKMKDEAVAKAQEDEANLSQSREMDLATGSDLIEPRPDSAVDVDVSDHDNCRLRFEHLTQTDGWRDCKQCELYMRKIAIKLYSAGLPDVNGLVAT